MLGYELTVQVETAHSDAAAAAATEWLVATDVIAMAGGYGDGIAAAICDVSRVTGVPFLNIGSSSIPLRNERCSPTTFHIEPRGGMYLDALAGWSVGAALRGCT